MDKTIKELAVELTVEITMVCDSIKGRTVFTNQLIRACSSIGANSFEAKYAQSNADFISKFQIALKECYETEYWLELFINAEIAPKEVIQPHLDLCGTIRRMLISSINTIKSK